MTGFCWNATAADCSMPNVPNDAVYSRDAELEILDGPHAGTIIYPRPPPTTLVCMDTDYCYHEYTRIEPEHGISRYRYHGRLGKPRWAAIIQTGNVEVTDA
jgi:hypothetical protein